MRLFISTLIPSDRIPIRSLRFIAHQDDCRYFEYVSVALNVLGAVKLLK